MSEKALKVVILDHQGQLNVFPNSSIEIDITLDELVDTIKTNLGLNGNYHIYIHASDLSQPLSNLRIRIKDIGGIVMLPADLQKSKVRLA